MSGLGTQRQWLLQNRLAAAGCRATCGIGIVKQGRKKKRAAGAAGVAAGQSILTLSSACARLSTQPTPAPTPSCTHAPSAPPPPSLPHTRTASPPISATPSPHTPHSTGLFDGVVALAALLLGYGASSDAGSAALGAGLGGAVMALTAAGGRGGGPGGGGGAPGGLMELSPRGLVALLEAAGLTAAPDADVGGAMWGGSYIHD